MGLREIKIFAHFLAMVRISKVEENSSRCPASERSVQNGT